MDFSNFDIWQQKHTVCVFDEDFDKFDIAGLAWNNSGNIENKHQEIRDWVTLMVVVVVILRPVVISLFFIFC